MQGSVDTENIIYILCEQSKPIKPITTLAGYESEKFRKK